MSCILSLDNQSISSSSSSSSSASSEIKISDLPPDVLTIIFRDAVSTLEDAKNLSLVCWRFFQIGENNDQIGGVRICPWEAYGSNKEYKQINNLDWQETCKLIELLLTHPIMTEERKTEMISLLKKAGIESEDKDKDFNTFELLIELNQIKVIEKKANHYLDKNQKLADLAKKLSKMKKFEQAVEIINKITNTPLQDEAIKIFIKEATKASLKPEEAKELTGKITLAPLY